MAITYITGKQHIMNETRRTTMKRALDREALYGRLLGTKFDSNEIYKQNTRL